MMKAITVLFALILLSACVGKPDKVEPITEFEVSKYLGKWYEIARLDHSFERGLSKVSAEYKLRDDGGIDVINRGYSEEDEEWQTAHGKAYFVEEPDQGYLKVSFFGPFYGSYIIFTLDKEGYEYAFVSGPNLSYLWLLSRAPKVDQQVINDFTEQAKALGFNTKELIFVDQ